MSFIDVAIPGILGLVLLIWPRSMFLGTRVTPNAKKIRLLRGGGVVLLLVAVVYLAIKLVGA
jgi:hypothetical protein